MTLLISTISDKCAVITADGLSRTNPTTGQGLASDNFKKIFPVPALPIAFAHHGFNIINNKTAGEFIDQYITEHDQIIANSDILTIANDFRTYAQAAVSSVFQNPTNRGVIGFWIIGFGKNKQKPELYEVCWPNRPTPYRFPRPVALGGDGKRFLDPLPELRQFPYHRIPKFSVVFATRYQQALYQHAEAEQERAGQVIFGGYQHQLSVDRNGWTWEKSPKS